MAEEKVKVRELAEQIGVPSKDMFRALHGLKMSAKTMSSSITLDEAARLREYFADKKNESVERTTVQPNVIVRRRKKGTPQDREAPKKEIIGEKAASEPAPQPTPSLETSSELAVEEKPEEKKAVARAPKGEERAAKKNLRNVGARVISRPGDEKSAKAAEKIPSKGEESPAAVPAPEKDQAREEKAPKQPKRQGKTLAEEIREREASERAKAREEATALKKKMERGASIISKPEPVKEKEELPAEPSGPAEPETPQISPVLAALSAREQEEKPVQAKMPKPEPAEAPVQETGHASEQEDKKSAAPEAKEDAKSRVRIISLPTPQAAQPRRPRPVQARADNAQVRPGGGRPAHRGARGSDFTPGFGAPARPVPPQTLPDQAAEGRDGQSKKKRLKGRRTVDFQQGDFGRHSEEEGMHFNRGKPRRKNVKAQVQPQTTQPIKAAKRKIRMAEAIRVADMAHQLGVKANEIIKVLFKLGVMATINQSLDFDTATLVASEFGYEVDKSGFSEEDYLTPKEADAPESLKSRPPVVTIMGHVDHGKTSLLDAVRKSNVTSGEAGGITQHIGAYHVKTKRGEIVFLDTPGHEAFTAMRARGAQITDLVILVVAADDGVMEQTREAINHARAAKVPIVVAVNKMDKPGADPDRVLRELSELGLQPEDWGGDTIVSKVSAKTRQGLDELLELVALQAEIMDLKANPDKLARGHIVEAKLDKGRGPVATVLVGEGTLHLGDNFVCGPFSGRVRAMTNDQGKKVKEAGPSLPVEVQGFDGVPEAGEEFLVVADDKLARRIADSRAIKRREKDLASESRVTLETFLAHHDDAEALTLNLVLKADVQGSLEAITEALHKQSTDKVKINIVHGGTGAISESDILLASASKAIIIGFNVRPAARIKDIAEHENVDIRYYDIIYKLVDDVKSAMAGLLAPVQREVYLGQAEVRKVYNLPKVGAIAGSYVADGKIARNAGVRLLRDGIVTYTGKISSLKRFKDDAREVAKGMECGIGLENFNDIKAGDILEAFETVEEAATL